MLKVIFKEFAPEKIDIVSLHSKWITAIFDQYGVTKQVKAAFGKTVNMNSGAYVNYRAHRSAYM
jgi:ribonuclease G